MTATVGEGITRLRYDTGATWLDLVATVGNAYGPDPVERLYDVDRLRTWLAAENLTPVAPPTEADLVRARQLRECLRELGLAAAHGKPWPRKAIALMNEVLADERPVQLRDGRRDGPRMSRPRTTVEALARIARQAAEHLTSVVAETLGTCADHDCGMLFLDPKGRRRWCATNICGVRNRVRAHRERKAQIAD